ncbi:MAG: S41 family peptidase [Gemmatimonadota bacterium]
MIRVPLVPPLLAALLLALTNAAAPQEPPLDSVLRFETAAVPDTLPAGWDGGPAATLALDTVVLHGGHASGRMVRDSASPGQFSSFRKMIPIGFAGDTIELTGWVRTADVQGFAGLWLREDGPTGVLQFDNMRNRGVRGTTGWTSYTLRLPLDEEADKLYVGALLVGTGTVWVDDLALRVDGKPLSEAPARTVARSVLSTDTAFAHGSGIALDSLTPEQVQNVAVLGRVWGFLKYHDPRVAAGDFQWDYELFRVLPEVLAAKDADARNRVLVAWIDGIGLPAPCGDDCAPAPPADAQLAPPIGWIHSQALLGPELSRRLEAVYRNRFHGSDDFYISQVSGVGNPQFRHEMTYRSLRPLDTGYRILALLRLWNMVEYWFPYRNLLHDDWPATLAAFLPRVVAAPDRDAYRLALMAFVARIGDTHANLWSELDVRPPRGRCAWPLMFRPAEGDLVVTDVREAATHATRAADAGAGGAGAGGSAGGSGAGADIVRGDVVVSIDGQPVDSLIQAWLPYYAASNRITQLRDIARFLGRGPCGPGRLAVERDGVRHDVVLARDTAVPPADSRDRPGDAFQLLSKDVAYLKLSSVKAADVPEYLRRAEGTRGLVIDIRNYPSAFMVFNLGNHLVRQPTPFARFSVGRLDNPGTFVMTRPISLQPASPTYGGKVVVLVDESSVSQAEYTTMAFRAAGAEVVGSTTAGADGNVSPIPLPGGMQSLFSGIGVFYPDGTPTQRVGIVPDVVVRPTIAGIRAGRDEVLEAAIREILPDADAAAIQRMAARPGPQGP